MKTLEEYRNEIDAIDNALAGLLDRRMQISEEVARVKQATGRVTRDPVRENAIVERIGGMVENPFYRDRILSIMRTVLESSRALQDHTRSRQTPEKKDPARPLSAGYPGIPGAFAESALYDYFGKPAEPYRSYPGFAALCDVVVSGELAYGILPVENTTTGSIKEAFDLIREKDLYVVGEVCLPIVHNLIGQLDADPKQLREIYSHSQGLEQCSAYLESLESVKCIPMKNTALSVRHVAEQKNPQLAAIGGEHAASLYGLRVLVPAIQNSSINTTRFFILSSRPETANDADCSSMVFTARHAAGALYEILGFFTKEKVSLLRIESRPVPDRPWEYFIFIDTEGSIENESVNRAVEATRAQCPYFKFLGSYRRGAGR